VLLLLQQAALLSLLLLLLLQCGLLLPLAQLCWEQGGHGLPQPDADACMHGQVESQGEDSRSDGATRERVSCM
jgi:hypothetical protein